MPVDARKAEETGFQLGQIGGGIIRHIVQGDQLDHQAELVAAMFEDTGHPTGAQIAALLRQSPQDGLTILQSMGGTRVAYDRILEMQAASQEQAAVDAQNSAILGAARIPLQGLPGPAQAAQPGAPGPAPVADPRAALMPQLEAVAAAGGDLAATISTMKKLGINFEGGTSADGILKELGIDPDSNSGESIDAFVQHYAETGQKKFSLLKARVTPKDKSPKPPAGTFFVEDASTPSGLRVVAIPGSHAEITQQADAIRLKLAKNVKLTPAEQAFLDSVDRVGAIQALMNDAIRGGGAQGGGPAGLPPSTLEMP